MRITHTADWHLAAMGNRFDEEGRNSRLMDLARCAQATMDGAVERDCDLILHAGDWTHTWRPTPTVVAEVQSALDIARAGNIPLIGIEGNHDVPRSAVDVSGPSLFRRREGVTILRRPDVLNVWKGPARTEVAPQNDATPDGGTLELQVACLPWPRRELLLAAESTKGMSLLQINQQMRLLVMEIITGLAARLIPGIPAVLLAHVPVEEAQIGKQTMAVSGEWTLSVHELLALPFDYIALGHIHSWQEWESEARIACYPGSPEAVTFGEEGQAKRWAEVTIAGGHTRIQQMLTPYRLLVTVEGGDYGGPSPEVEGAIVRLRIPHADRAVADAVRENMLAAGAHEVRVEILPEEIVRRREVDLAAEDTLEAGIDAWLTQHPDLADKRDALIEEARLIERMVAE